MRPLRILHVNDVANVGSTFVEGLRALGQDASLLPLRLAGGKYSLYLKLLLFLPTRLRELSQVNRAITSGAYDVVHIHYAYLGWLGIFGRYKYYLHCHGDDVRVDLNHPIRKNWVIPSLKNARKVFFVTPNLAEIVRSVRPDAVFLPDPVRTDIFTPGPRSASRRGPGILLLSELDDKIKGTQVAMQAFSQLHERYPGVRISAMARGRDLPKYRHISWIEFVEPVDYLEMSGLIGRFDIVVGQFALGAMGMSELESMACGKPVVCYHNYPDWYPEPPPVLSANEPSGVAEYLARLMEDEKARSELGMQSQEWVQKYHGYIEMARKLLEIYSAR